MSILKYRRLAFRSAANPNVPPVTANLQIQLDPGQLVGLNDGDALTTNSDFSGNGYDAASSGTARPLYKTGQTPNGRPCVRFDGLDDTMSFSGGALGIFNDQAGATIYVLAKSTWLGGVPKYTFYASTGSGAGTTRVSLALSEGASPGGATGRGRRLDADSLTTVGPGAGITDSSWHYYSLVVDWANSNLDLYKDGTPYLSTTSFQTDGNTSATNSLAMNLGSVNGGANFNGDLSDVLVYRGAHNTTDRQLVEAWLAGR